MVIQNLELEVNKGDITSHPYTIYLFAAGSVNLKCNKGNAFYLNLLYMELNKSTFLLSVNAH